MKSMKRLSAGLLTIIMLFSVMLSGLVSVDAANVDLEVGTTDVISFDVNSSGWGNVKTVYCHVWKADGTGTWPNWQTNTEKCEYNTDTGIATYNLSKTGNKINKTDGKIYCVIFSANTGMQTYDVVMSGGCIGDTVYCTGKSFASPSDSEKLCVEAAWYNNKDCGSKRAITMNGDVIGTAHIEGESDITIMTDYLIAYYDSDNMMSYVDSILTQMNLEPAEVKNAVINKLKDTQNPDADKIIAKVNKVLYGDQSISLNKAEITLGVGESYTLTATSYPSDISDIYTWGTSNKNIATVSGGKVTGKAVGTAKITVEISNGKTAVCNVTVKKAPTSITLNKSAVTLGVGEAYTLTKTIPSGSSSIITWTSSNTKVATISKGKITPKAVGTATITVSTFNGKKATCNLTVKKAPTSITLNKSAVTLGVGEAYTLTKTLSSGSSSVTTWTSSNTKVATISKGKITPKAVGTATITASTFNGKKATCNLTVKKAPTSIKLNKTAVTLGVGEAYTLTKTLSSGSSSVTTWTSSNTKVATISKGKITPKAVGTATITAKTFNGKKATCKVTVKKAPTSISLNKSSVSISVGATYTLTKTLSSGSSSVTTWTSSNTKVATVSGGKITAKGVGTATITAKTYNGKTATCKVTVKAKSASVATGSVWIPTNGGKKYHSSSSCSNMKDPIKISLSEAKSKGFEACKKCY